LRQEAVGLECLNSVWETVVHSGYSFLLNLFQETVACSGFGLTDFWHHSLEEFDGIVFKIIHRMIQLIPVINNISGTQKKSKGGRKHKGSNFFVH
jgi:hypothetical protein